MSVNIQIQKKKLPTLKSRKNTPYPAEFLKIRGFDYLEKVTCGHNPFLFARKVENLKKDKKTGKIIWKEREISESFLKAVDRELKFRNSLKNEDLK